MKMLKQELASAIVSKLISILGKNINLMDERGVIIASGDPARIGTFHEGAAYVIKSGKPLEISPKDVDALEGVRPGINVPITLENRTVGVVGITGEPSEVRNYAQIVRYTVELMLEQAALKEQVHMKERVKEVFLHDLLSGNWETEEEVLMHRASLIGFDLSIPRVAIVLSFSQTEGLNQIEFLRELSNEIVRSPDKRSLVGLMGSNRLVILTPIDLNSTPKQQRRRLEQLSLRALEQAKKHRLQVVIGVGRYHPELEGIKKSYMEGLEAVSLGKIFCPEVKIHFFEDLQVEYLVSKLPNSLKRAFWKMVLGRLVASNDKYTEELLNTLKNYFEEDLSIKKTSQRLFIHRNTLFHRLKKIQSATGLDPTKFTDAFKLKLALLLYLYEKENLPEPTRNESTPS
ncbi:MAG: Transcriptional regulator, CdaR [Thermoanaerobacterales bacterium 50_218]|nr:MAG: Transcriptional regulator, CdaR [Thermoanaerobacterales bacterium 50_218]